MNNFTQLSEIEDAVIRYIQGKKASKVKIIKDFTSKLYSKNTIKRIIDTLEKSREYIKLSEKRYSKRQIMFLDDPINDEDWEHVYLLTPLGMAYLARSSANFTSYSNINNSNIAHESPNTTQTIEINELSEDLQSKVAEFDQAVEKNDGKAMMKVIGYIADKSIDVAIAVMTGALIR